MKWIKRIAIAFAALLVILILGLLIAGQRSDRGYFEISVMINRPAKDVFAALTDPDMIAKWVSGVVDVKHMNEGTKGVGAIYRLTEDINGQRVVMYEEVTAFEPPFVEKYTARGTGNPPEFTEQGEYRLEEKNGQTIFTMISRIEYHGFLYQLLEPLITPSVREKFVGDQKKLKVILEAEPMPQQ